MTKGHEVVCVGLATRDTILAVPRHPGPDDRVVADALAVAGGGPAATAAVTLARLGVEVAFVGAVGDDDAGAEIRTGLEAEGVDVSELRTVAGTRSAQSTILVGAGTRAIVTVPGPEVELSPRALELCRAADWVHADHAGYAAVRPLQGELRISLDAGNPVPELELAGLALYAPTERSLAGPAEDAVAAGARLVVVTRGERGACALDADGGRVEAPAFPVEPVSTLGAGDVFHGALLAGLVRGAALSEALAAANACAALSCRALDGRSAIPRAAELDAVLERSTA